MNREFLLTTIGLCAINNIIFSFRDDYLSGKTSTYTSDDGNVLTSIRPESIEEVDEMTRDLWILDTAKQTIERIKEIDSEKGPNSKLAKEHYSTDTDHYLSMVKKAIESI